MPHGTQFMILVKMMTGVVVSYIKKEKTAMICDNAHALDLQTWTSLRLMSKALPRNLLLVLAQRAVKNGDVKKIADFFKLSPTALYLELGNLSSSNTARVVSAIFGVNKIPRPLVDAIFEKCKGHPRFIHEIAELLLAEEKVIIKDGVCTVAGDLSQLKLPNTIRAVFVSRMDQLSSSEQITLKVASVIGAV